MAVKPVVAIVGRANVGKSSLFNRLTGHRQAVTHASAGTTRDANFGDVTWGKHNFMLVDTAGLETGGEGIETQVRDQIDRTARTAQLIIVAVDSTTMINTEDRQAAKLALKTGKPVVLALTKADDVSMKLADRYESLGIKNMIRVSAIHGTGTGDLLDAVTSQIEAAPAAPEDDVIRVALLGRPNVGKSSLLNSLVGKQQAIVSSLAGTTRDVTTAPIKYHGRTIEFLDTAGLRRRGKIEQGVEKFSTLRTQMAIMEADVCLVLMDATEMSVAGDQHIAGMVDEAGKGLVLIVNKWDLPEKDDHTQARMERKLQQDFQFVWWAPLVFTSAETGMNVTRIFDLVTEIYDRRQMQITTGKLNRLLQDFMLKQPPAGAKGKQPKLNYATQTGSNPPEFTFFGSYINLIHFGYKRYLENGLRKEFDLTGTPISLEFKAKHHDTK
jgi:GTP-binding protein